MSSGFDASTVVAEIERLRKVMRRWRWCGNI
jgi:hypothetical protein